MASRETGGRQPQEGPGGRQAGQGNRRRRQDGRRRSGGQRRLFAAVEKARKASVTRDVIERAIGKGAGHGRREDEPRARGVRGLRAAQGAGDRRVHDRQSAAHGPGDPRCCSAGACSAPAGSNKFLFDHVGLVEAHTADPAADAEAAAIEAGANDFEPLTHAQNDDIPEGAAGVRFVADRTAVHAVTTWLKEHGWTVVTSELGYVAKQFPELTEAQRADVGEFLQIARRSRRRAARLGGGEIGGAPRAPSAAGVYACVAGRFQCAPWVSQWRRSTAKRQPTIA